MLFADRADAGQHLAQRLRYLRDADVAVLGLPRGGVPVAFEVAEELRAPLDVIVVRKLGLPGQPEYGFGAIGEDGTRVIDDRVVHLTELTGSEIAAVEARERTRLDRRVRQLRGDRAPIPLAGHPVIVVDDGMATGSTARAACIVARARGASGVILAVPVASVEATASLGHAADEVICLHTPATFLAISEWYDDFSQVSDEEVTVLLGKAAGSPRLEGDRMQMFGHRKGATRADRVKLDGAPAVSQVGYRAAIFSLEELLDGCGRSVEALDHHGYARGDDEHTGWAILLINDLSHIYEGSLDRAGPLTMPQASRHATDRIVAPPHRALDAGLRPGPFADQAASLLPGLLAAARTGLPPAGDDELTNTKNHHGITSRCHLPLCWAHERSRLERGEVYVRRKVRTKVPCSSDVR